MDAARGGARRGRGSAHATCARRSPAVGEHSEEAVETALSAALAVQRTDLLALRTPVRRLEHTTVPAALAGYEVPRTSDCDHLLLEAAGA